jgi:hypothetical protein
MRDIFRTASILLLLSCTSAFAFDNIKIANIKQAADSFVTLAGDSAHTGKPPRQSDPSVKKLLDVVFDTTEIQRGAVYQSSDLKFLGDWLSAVLKVGLIYSLSGSGIGDIHAVPNDPEIIKKIDHNAVLFAPEMGRYYDAQMLVQGAVMDVVSGILTAASQSDLDRPNFKDGIAQIRAGTTQSINGVITTLTTDGVADSWRRERLAVLLTVAPKIAKLLIPEQLLLLRQSTAEVAGQMTDPVVKSQLSSIIETLRR